MQSIIFLIFGYSLLIFLLVIRVDGRSGDFIARLAAGLYQRFMKGIQELGGSIWAEVGS
jgi:hypothetical protein